MDLFTIGESDALNEETIKFNQSRKKAATIVSIN